MIQGLRTVIYPVRDMAASTTWYSRLLQVTPYFEQPYYVGFTVGGCELGLIPDGAPGPGGPLAYWGVAALAGELERLRALGVAVHTPPTDVGDGIRIATLRDPDGNLLGIIENPHFNPREVR